MLVVLAFITTGTCYKSLNCHAAGCRGRLYCSSKLRDAIKLVVQTFGSIPLVLHLAGIVCLPFYTLGVALLPSNLIGRSSWVFYQMYQHCISCATTIPNRYLVSLISPAPSELNKYFVVSVSFDNLKALESEARKASCHIFRIVICRWHAQTALN